MDWNWLSDQTRRVVRTIREVVAEVEDSTPSDDELKEIWTKIRAALNRALIPHPVAHAAVLHELEVEFVEQVVPSRI